MKDGILCVDKPEGMTSHDVVAIVRRKLKIKKVGHAGTLDPLATGLLIVLVGKATKFFDRFVGFDKGYLSTLRLGVVTDTGDTQGQVLEERDWRHVGKNDLGEVFSSFVGETEQIPPMYSAVKVKGKKLYELARKGIVIEREPRPIRIDELTIEKTDLPDVVFSLKCSKGTYVRQLAHDIGQKLGCGAHISRIRRTRIGDYDVKDAVSIEDIDERYVRDWEES